MDNYAKDVLAIIDRFPPYPDYAGSSVRERHDGLDKQWREIGESAEALQTSATGDLRGFACEDSLHLRNPDGSPQTVLRPNIDGVPTSLGIIANNAWRSIGGDKSPALAAATIAAARVEFARSSFHSLAIWIYLSHLPGFGPQNSIPAARERFLATDWTNADSLARTPAPVWRSIEGSDSAARDFNEWLWHDPGFDEREPFKSIPNAQAHSALCGIALAWIDEAICAPNAALSLMAEAADALEHAGIRMGWDMHAEYLNEPNEKPQTVSALARHAANARHASNRAAREKARELFRTGDFGSSKDAAAERIATLTGWKYRTTREWLKGDD